MGGAIGKLIDRILYGRVADFLHLHLGSVDPFRYIFNLSDSAITISVGVLLIDQAFRRRWAFSERADGLHVQYANWFANLD